MTSAIQLLYSYYTFIDQDLADPRTTNWFLVGSIWNCFAIVGVYCYFIYNLGPALMAKRKPYDLQKIMVVYNIAQIFLNMYIAYQSIHLGWFWKYKFICEPVDYSNTAEAVEIASAVWVFYMIKIFDLLDTIFFVLRKKQNQVTFLHVYHHAGMIIASWAGVKYLPGGHGTFIGMVNSFVHIVMYTHYLATSLKLGVPWWKKYITQMQLFQFYAVFIHFVLAVLTKDCAYPKWLLITFLPQNCFMVVLFTDFYIKTYLNKTPKMDNRNGVSNTTDSKQNNIELPNGKSKTY